LLSSRPASLGGNEPRIWRLADGAFRHLRASAAKGGILGTQETTAVRRDFLVELRGFEVRAS
jgi:hypothetical protein